MSVLTPRPPAPLAVLVAASPALVGASGVLPAAVLAVLILVVLTATTVTVAYTRGFLSGRLHLVAQIAVVALLVTCADLIVGAALPGVRRDLGVWLPLCVAASVVLVPPAAGRGEVLPALLDALTRAAVLGVGMVALGCARELLGGVVSGLGGAPEAGRPGGGPASSPYVLAPTFGLFLVALALAIRNRVRRGGGE